MILDILILALAVACLSYGLVLIYRPAWVLRINKIAREKVFNDYWTLSNRKKGGIFFLTLSFIFSFLAYHEIQYSESRVSLNIISTDRLLYQSLQHLYAKQYQKSKILAERVLSREPENAEALYQLAACQICLGDAAGGDATWMKARKLCPDSAEARRLREMIVQVNPASVALK